MLFCMASSVSAQNSPAPDSSHPAPFLLLGLGAALGRSIGTGALAIPGISAGCGGVLADGSGSSWRASLLVEIPLSAGLAVQILPGVARSHMTLATTLPGVRPLRSAGEPGGFESSVIDRILDIYRTDLSLAALVRIPVAGGVHASAGLGVAHTISSDQIHRLVIASPSTALFRNGRRDDTVSGGADPILDAPTLVPAGVLSAGYDLPISSRSTLTPSLTLTVPFVGRTTEGNWRDISLELGASLRFGLTRTPVVDSIIPPPVPVIPALSASILTRPPVIEVRIDEYDSVEALPVLNQVFFAEGSSRIPERYHLLDREGSTVFTRDQLKGSALDVYYHMLNLIGKRLQEIPSATLTVNGYRNSRESDPRLGTMRAESVRRYLVDVWRISQRRITVRGGALPPSPARENAEEGFEENARVELLSSDPNITKPHFRRHIQRVANPPGVTFYPSAVAEAGLGRWQVEVVQEGKPWKSFAGTGALPDSIVWDWRGDQRELPQLPMRLSYRLEVVDSTGQMRTTEPTPIAVNYRSVGQKMERRVNDTTINIYSLLLFNYDSPRLSPGDQELINAINASSGDVTPQSIVHFTGYTDSLGDAEHNRQLANARAAEAARLFQSSAPRGVSIVVHDDGGERERFPYTTPEGRSHDRTVIIEIRTPVEVKKDGVEGDS